ncbi:hypothetical protein D3H55_10605 [Bacillus salacetis]|uniref:Uncharacterized protein n=1 Tax=Bacillus salacetis TaxID=2315464 RepID=A0A3A1R063_9BACI|nr:hypothetical protein [Bacillus salacetis]RIW34038.1 hypothetical protein D3H55_10605 [Bacillus salacetis]
MLEKSLIKQRGQTNLAVQNSDIHITVSIYDEIERLANEGRHNEVADRIKKLLDFVGTKHPLFPHYRYKPARVGNTTVLEHEALTKEAYEKYPLSYSGRFKLANHEKQKHIDIRDVIEEAYYKQEEIEINMQSFSTWLGDQMVETPNLDQSFENGKWVIVPKALPEPMKMKFYFKGESDTSIVDYLEMGVSGKEDGKFILIDNSSQNNSKLLITLKLPLYWDTDKEYGKSTEAKINVKIKPDFRSNVEANRLLLKFLMQVSNDKGIIAFKNLEADKDIIIAPNFSFEGDFENLEKDHMFIERLYKIEKYYNLQFSIPEELDESDWEWIEILENAIENKPVKKKLKMLSMELNDKEAIQNIIEHFDSNEDVKKLMFEQSGSEARLELFNEIIPIEKVQSIYNSLRLDALEKIKGKLKYMDQGDTIKVNFVPGDDPVFSEYYFFEKKV